MWLTILLITISILAVSGAGIVALIVWSLGKNSNRGHFPC